MAMTMPPETCMMGREIPKKLEERGADEGDER